MKRIVLVTLFALASCTAPTSPPEKKQTPPEYRAPTLTVDSAVVTAIRSADGKSVHWTSPTLTMRAGTAALPSSITVTFSPSAVGGCAKNPGVFATTASTALTMTSSQASTGFPMAVCPTSGVYETGYFTLTAKATADGHDLSASVVVVVR